MASTGFKGADTDRLDLLSDHMRTSSTDLASLTGRLVTQWSGLEWYGGDADHFRSIILKLTTAMLTTAQALQTVSGVVQKQSEQQKQASGVTGSSPVAAAAAYTGPLPSVPGVGSPPATVKVWWDHLSPSVRQALIQRAPERIGGLDGVPVVARSAANEIVLQQQEVALIDENKALMASVRFAGFGAMHLLGRVEGNKAKIAAIDHIQAKLAGDSDYYLLGSSTKGSGQFIMALGNPDTAKHVAVFVPGMTSKLAGAAGLIGQAEAIRGAALQADPTASTSSIVWLGYDAPQNPVSAGLSTWATSAGDELDSFVDGIQATHNGGSADVTVVPHSYGSVVAGMADRDHQLAAQRMFIIGSPGVGVDNASSLSMGASNVWASRAPNDVIRWAPSIGELLFGPWPFDQANDDQLRFGTDPSSPSFGAHVVPTVVDPDGQIDAHSSYFDPDNPAMIAIGQVVTGRRP